MSIAVIYARVSSATQVTKGDGLGSQESRCREYAAYKGHDVAEVFHETGVTGGITDRPAVRAMLTWLRKHRAEEPVVIIDDISRIARGVVTHWELRSAIGACGGRLESPSIEFGEDSDSQLIENMLASVSQHHRQKNAEQVRHRMTARLKSGYFCFWAPVGYTYVASQGEGKILKRDEPAAGLIQEALEGFASKRFQSQADVRRFLEPHGLFSRDQKGEIHPQRIKNILTNKIYAGYYEHKDWGVPLMKGRHEALISWETFQRIQERLAEGTYVAPKVRLGDDFPLRGHVTCGSCGHPMSAYWAKGRSKKYPYYECFQKGCDARRKSIRRDDLEGDFERLLTQLRPSAPMISAAAQMFRDAWDMRTSRVSELRKEQRKSMKSLDSQITRLADRLIDTDSPATIRAYERKLEKLEAERIIIREKLAEPAPEQHCFDHNFRTALDFLANPRKLWENGDPISRKTCLNLVFAAPLPYVRNKGFRTAKTTIPFKVLGGNPDGDNGMAEGT